MADTMTRMGRKKKTDEDASTQEGGTDTVRVNKELARMLTIIAIRRGVSVSTILSPHLEPWVKDLYRKEVEQMHTDVSQWPEEK